MGACGARLRTGVAGEQLKVADTLPGEERAGHRAVESVKGVR